MPILFNNPESKLSPQLLTAMGAGLLTGNTWNEQIANAGLGASNAISTQQQQQQLAAAKNQTVQMLQTSAPDIAAAVAAGAMTPNEGITNYLKQKAEAITAAKPQFQKFDDGSYGWVSPSTKSVDIVGNAQRPYVPEAAKEQQYWMMHPDEYTAYNQKQMEEQKQKEMTTLQKDLIAAGIQPGTPEFNKAVLAAHQKPGMTIESDGKGGFRLTQGGVNTPQKLTEDQSKNIAWLERGSSANKELDDVGDELTSIGGYAADQLGPAGNYLKTSAYQKADRAGKDFLAVVLRKDSGGAITQEEMATYSKIYLPQPGDDANTLQTKANARRTILDSIKAGLGGAANQTRNDPNAAAPNVDDLVKKYGG